MKIRTLLATGCVSAVLLTTTALPAQAATPVPRIPLTCGMVVTRSAVVYLAKNLTCATTFGVRVDYPEGEDNPSTPSVTVDLQGHTLRGLGTEFSLGVGGGSDEGGPVVLRVIHGKLQHWYWGGFTGSNGEANDVKLVDNEIGWGCNGTCTIVNSYFANNGDGLLAADARVSVRGSIFTHNDQGIDVGIAGFSVENSAFIKNGVGIYSPLSGATVTKSAFIRNRTAILTVDDGGNGACVRLSRVVLLRNGVNVAQPSGC